MSSWVSIIPCSEVSVKGRDNSVLLPFFHVLPEKCKNREDVSMMRIEPPVSNQFTRLLLVIHYIQQYGCWNKHTILKINIHISFNGNLVINFPSLSFPVS